MPRSASAVGLAKRGVIPRKQFYIELFVFNTVILVPWIEMTTQNSYTAVQNYLGATIVVK
jgi:hypothetical protein